MECKNNFLKMNEVSVERKFKKKIVKVVFIYIFFHKIKISDEIEILLFSCDCQFEMVLDF